MSLPNYSDLKKGGKYTKVDVCTGDCINIPAASREVAARWTAGFMVKQVNDQMNAFFMSLRILVPILVTMTKTKIGSNE